MAYAVTVPAGTSAVIRIIPSGFDAVVFVAESPSLCGVTCSASADAAGFNGAEVVTIDNRSRPTSTYFVVVDGSGALQFGPFSILATLQFPDGGVFPLPGDTCDTAPPLPLSGQFGSVQSSTIDTTNGESSWCGGAAGNDRSFALTVSAFTSGLITLSVTSSQPGFEPIIAVRRQCGGPVIACGPNSGSSAQLTTFLPQGSFIVTVDSRTGIAGDFLLSATRAEPMCSTGLSCMNPIPLVLHDNQAWASGCLESFGQSSVCGESGEGDVTYRIDVPQTSHLVVSTAPKQNPTDLSTLISSTACSSIGSSRCGLASTASAPSENILLVDAGSWHVTVDSPASSIIFPTTSYELFVQLETPAPNSTCGSASPLPLNGTVVGSTRGGRNQSPRCGSGRQLFYDLTLPSVSSGSVVARSLDGGARPALTAFVNSCATDAGVSCGGASSTFSFDGLPSGRHSFAIESADPTQTVVDFALDVRVDAGIGLGTCASPIPLAGSGVSQYSGSTQFFGSSLVGTGACSTANGPELVFSFTTTATHVFAANLSNTSSLNPRMYLRTNCTSVAGETCGFSSLSNNALPPGTYFIVVDGSGTTSGTFQLNVLLN